jgi:hypothetical protein
MTCNTASWLRFSSPGHTYHEYGGNIKAGSLIPEEIQIYIIMLLHIED